MNDFDKLLDQVLRQETQVEPLSGIERRVMARIRMEPQKRLAWKFIAWGTAGVAMAAWLVTLVLWSPHRVSPTSRQLEATVHRRMSLPSIEPPTDDLQLAGRPRTGPQEAAARMAPGQAIVETTLQEAEALPKLDVFPTPDSMAEPIQELAAVSQHSRVVAGLGETSSEPEPPAGLKVEPITIARIEIAPLYPLLDAKGNKLVDDKGDDR
jgi:hypothetical protein